MDDDDKILKSNLYENNEVYHPNGNLMFYCKMKRVDWYLNKGLAEKIGHKKYQLTFVPGGEGEPIKYLNQRRNMCVVSGSKDNLTKHHVVPYMYRKLFPIKYKDKNSTDLVLLTEGEHSIYERFADDLKKDLLDKHISSAEIENNRNIYSYEKNVRILRNHMDSIPAKNLYNISETIKKFRINGINDLEILNLTKLVVEREGVESLIRLWKSHFIEYAKPRFLPKWWNPNDIKKIIR